MTTVSHLRNRANLKISSASARLALYQIAILGFSDCPSSRHRLDGERHWRDPGRVVQSSRQQRSIGAYRLGDGPSLGPLNSTSASSRRR